MRMISFIILFLFPCVLSAKPAPGSSPPSKRHLLVLGGDISPKIYGDTIDDQFWKVAITLSSWKYENERHLHGTGGLLGFEGERGENHEWVELRFFLERSIGLYYFGHGQYNPWSLLYANVGGASLGPILEISTRSLDAQGLGLKANVWHMIGPIGVQMEARSLTSRTFNYNGGLMVRLPLPLIR